MADDSQIASRADNKRKLDDAIPPASRRPTGFSTGPIASPALAAASAAAPTSYYTGQPPMDEIQLAKQRAQEIAARLFNSAEAKRPRVENGGAGEDSSAKGFGSALGDQFQKHISQQISSQSGTSLTSSFSSYGFQGSTKKINVPNGRVGVIIGKGGETIKYLQLQSGARIQVTRDADSDPYSDTRMVELVGTSEQISRAEELINDVLSEADAGGSGVVAGRRMVPVPAGAEQLVMRVPNNKVGLIIGKGGETIRNMQAKSGARIQLIPLHPPPGDTSNERTVQIDGTAEQIESAKQLVNEIVELPSCVNRARNLPMHGAYSQQGYRPPQQPTSWGPPGAPPMQQPGYGYMQPGAYPGSAPQYNVPQAPYGGYAPPPTSGGSGWDQSSHLSTQQGVPGTGYDYYNQQQSQHPQQQQLGGSAAPTDNVSYNYGQPPSYNTQGSYTDSSYPQSTVGQQQSYGQDAYGYQAQAPQAGGYSQPASNAQTAYDHQQGYGSAAYGTMTNPIQDGSATSTYGNQVAPTQVPSAQQTPPPVQPAATQPSYTGQQHSATSAGYPAQPTGQPGFGIPPTSQAGYGAQPSPQTYGQPVPVSQTTYGQPPQGLKPASAQAPYGQAQQPPSAQTGYLQTSPAQPGYAHGQQPPSAYPSGVPQAGYGQQPSYNGGPPPSQASYGQQQQQSYADSGPYLQPPVSHDAPPAAQSVPSGVAKTSPQA